MKDDRERLRDILEAIQAIEKYAARGRAACETDELLQVWMVHHIQIIGEAARRLSEALKNRHPEVPWTEIVAMRNILVHDYFAADMNEVWLAVERGIPQLKQQITDFLRELEESK